jgi:hypothetical protein
MNQDVDDIKSHSADYIDKSFNEDEKALVSMAINYYGSGQHPLATVENIYGFNYDYIVTCILIAEQAGSSLFEDDTNPTDIDKRALFTIIDKRALFRGVVEKLSPEGKKPFLVWVLTDLDCTEDPVRSIVSNYKDAIQLAKEEARAAEIPDKQRSRRLREKDLNAPEPDPPFGSEAYAMVWSDHAIEIASPEKNYNGLITNYLLWI